MMIEVKATEDFASKRIKYIYDAMKDVRYTDVFFVVRNQSFFAHMVVLSACSDFFKQNEDKLSSIFFNYEYPIIDAILKYCYTGEIKIEDKYYEKFIQLADILQIKNISPRFVRIDADNCLEVLRLSDDPNSKKKAIDLVIDNFKVLYKTHSFQSLPAFVLSEILKSNKFVSAEDSFNCVKSWVNFDFKNRRIELPELLKHANLSTLSMEFLISEVMDFCAPNAKCIGILKEAMLSILPFCKGEILKGGTNDRIAVVGDWNTSVANSFDIYNGTNDTWNLTESFKFDREEFASVIINDWILIIGGYYTSNKVEYIDLKNGQKYPLNPLNYGRHYFSAVKLSHGTTTDVYAIGGYNGNKMSSVERWNSETQIWDTNVASLLLAVELHSASVIGNRIYVTGGIITKDEVDVSTNKVQVYIAETNSWHFCASMNQSRHNHSSIVIEGKLYVAGGYVEESNVYLDSIESYDSGANLWTFYSKLPYPARGICLCYFRNKLICLGGNNGKDDLSEVWEYDSVGKTWNPLKSLSTSRRDSIVHVIPCDSKLQFSDEGYSQYLCDI